MDTTDKPPKRGRGRPRGRKDKETFTTTFPPDVKRRLEAVARAWGMDHNRVIEKMLDHIEYGVPLPPLPTRKDDPGDDHS